MLPVQDLGQRLLKLVEAILPDQPTVTITYSLHHAVLNHPVDNLKTMPAYSSDDSLLGRQPLRGLKPDDWRDYALGCRSEHRNTTVARKSAFRLGAKDSNLHIRIQSPLSYH